MSNVLEMNKQFLNSSLPVFIETGSDDWPYSVRGTFFIIKIQSDFYAVTARHVVEGNDENTIFFRYSNSSRNSLPLNRIIENTGYKGKSSPEYTDIVLFQINKNEIQENMSSINMDVNNKPWEKLSTHNTLILRGYPSELQETEHSGVKEQAVIIDAKYCYKSERPNCHCMKFYPVEAFTFHDGFSGTPVFLMWRSKLSFVGMLVKACSYNNTGLFIDASVLLRMVNDK